MTNRTALSNSAAAVDFNKEVSGFLSNNANANGRELRLAVAIHNDVASFNPADILGGVGAKNKATALKNALLKSSDAFKSQCDAHDKAKRDAKGHDARAFAAKATSEAMGKNVQAAISMFERALIIAYFMRSTSAVVLKVNDKVVNVRYGRNLEIGDVTYANGDTTALSRKGAYEAGRALANSRGMIKAKTATRNAAGTGAETGSQKVLTQSAATFADTVAKLPSKDKADISTSPEFEKMLVSSIRARFEADGEIDMTELHDFIRKHDAMSGVRIIVGSAASKRKAG